MATKWKRLTPFFLCSSFLWPEGSLGCLKDSKRLSLEQLTKLTKICDKFNRKVSGGDLSDFHDRFQDKPESMLPIIKPLRCSKLYLTLYECRSHERVLLNEEVQLKDGGQKLCVIEPEEKEKVEAIFEETLDPKKYWYNASKDGHRENHYRGPKVGSSLIVWVQEHSSAPPPFTRYKGETIEWVDPCTWIKEFTKEVERVLPGLYAFFDENSLHVTIRAIT